MCACWMKLNETGKRLEPLNVWFYSGVVSGKTDITYESVTSDLTMGPYSAHTHTHNSKHIHSLKACGWHCQPWHWKERAQ